MRTEPPISSADEILDILVSPPTWKVLDGVVRECRDDGGHDLSRIYSTGDRMRIECPPNTLQWIFGHDRTWHAIGPGNEVVVGRREPGFAAIPTLLLIPQDREWWSDCLGINMGESPSLEDACFLGREAWLIDGSPRVEHPLRAIVDKRTGLHLSYRWNGDYTSSEWVEISFPENVDARRFYFE